MHECHLPMNVLEECSESAMSNIFLLQTHTYELRLHGKQTRSVSTVIYVY